MAGYPAGENLHKTMPPRNKNPFLGAANSLSAFPGISQNNAKSLCFHFFIICAGISTCQWFLRENFPAIHSFPSLPAANSRLTAGTREHGAAEDLQPSDSVYLYSQTSCADVRFCTGGPPVSVSAVVRSAVSAALLIWCGSVPPAGPPGQGSCQSSHTPWGYGGSPRSAPDRRASGSLRPP